MAITQIDGAFIEDKSVALEDVTDYSLDHNKLINIGTRTHQQIDNDLNLLINGVDMSYATKAMPTANQTISRNITTKINFNRLIHESVAGVYNTSTVRYTAPVDGIYQCVYLLVLDGTTAGRVMWYINGSEADRLASTNAISNWPVTTNFELAAGEFVEVYVNFGTNRTVYFDYSHCCMHRIA